MMEMGILSWPAALPGRKALEISDSSFGVTGSKKHRLTKVTREKTAVRDRRVNFFGYIRADTRKITTKSISNVYWISNFLVVNFTDGIDFKRFLLS